MLRVRLNSPYKQNTNYSLLGKRLYCPCLSFSEAVTKESLGLSREADEGEEEVYPIQSCKPSKLSRPTRNSPGYLCTDCDKVYLSRTPLLVLSP